MRAADEPRPRADPRIRPPQARRLKVRYGPATDGRQDVEVFVPEGFGPFPVVVLLHGGGFTAGSRDGMASLARTFQAHGVIGVAPSYRLSPDPPEPDNADRIRHPAHTDDAATVVRWVVDHRAELRADGDAIVLLGHSSGSTMATLLAFAPGYLDRAGVDRGRIAGVLRIDGHTSDVADLVPREQPYDNAGVISTFGPDRDVLYPPIVDTDSDGQPVYGPPSEINVSPWYEVTDSADLPPAFIASGSAPDRAFHSTRLHERLLQYGHASTLWPTGLDHGRMLGALRRPETFEERIYQTAVLDFVMGRAHR